MNKLTLLFFVCFVTISAKSQRYFVQNVVELEHDLSARTKPVQDKSGKECALIRISIPSVNNITFDSAIVGEPQCFPGEYNVYLAEATETMIICVEKNNLKIDFPKYGIKIEGKKCYRIVLSRTQHNVSSKTQTTIEANYDNVVILVDGIPVGQTPLFLDNIPVGKHLVSVPNTIGVTMKDSIITFSEENHIVLSLHKEKYQPVYVNLTEHPDGEPTINWGIDITEKDGKKGLVDYAGNILVPFEFDYINPVTLHEEYVRYYCVERDNKSGLYEPNKGLIVPCIYDFLRVGKEGIFIEKDGKWGVLSPTGKLVIPIAYEGFEKLSNYYYEHVSNYIKEYVGASKIKVYVKNQANEERVGIFSYDGKKIVNPKYECLGDKYINGYIPFKNTDGSVGLVDTIGNEIILPSKYDYGFTQEIKVQQNGLICFKDKETGKYGCIDTSLNLVIPPHCDNNKARNLDFDCNGFCKASIDGKNVLYDSKGHVIIDFQKKGWDSLEYLGNMFSTSDNTYYFYAKDQNNYKGLVDENGKMVLPFTYNSFMEICIGNNTYLICEDKNELWGIIDISGKTILPFKYKDIQPFSFEKEDETYFLVLDENQHHVIDEQFNVVFSLPSTFYVDIYKGKSDGYIMVFDEESHSYGYLNKRGEVIANCIYGNSFFSEIYSKESGEITYDGLIRDEPISEGLAIINMGDKFGYVDNKGNVKVPLIYTAVTPFVNGVCYARLQDGSWKKIYRKDL